MTGQLAQKSFYLYNPIVTADATGTATADLFVPVVPSGPGTISLVGLTSSVVDTSAFTVVPRIDTGASIAPAGSTLTFAGWGFGAKEEVTVQWAGTLAVKASTDAKGSFSGKTFTIPPDAAPGSYTVTANGVTTGITSSATVTVGATPTGPAPGTDDWPNWGFDQQQHRVNTAETAFNTTNVRTLSTAWQASIPKPDKYQASPTVANGIVYIGSIHGVLSAYNETTGALLWSYQAPGSIYASPAISNGIAYFGTVNEPQESQAGNYAIALNAQTGAVIWADALPDGADWAPPLIAGGDVFYPMANREGMSGGMIAFDAMTGAKIWQDTMNEGVWGPPTLDPSGQYYYQGTGNPCSGTGPSDPIPCAGQMLKVSLADGSYTTLIQTPDLSGDDDVPAAPTYDNGNLYFGGKDGLVFSISATTGSVNWEYNTGFIGDSGIYGSTTVDNGLVIFESIGARKVFALHESDGSLAWSYNTGGGGPNSPSVVNGVVFVASYGGKLLALNESTGALLWSSALGVASGSSAVVANGMVFQPAGNGTLYAYQIPPLGFSSPSSATATVGTPFSFTVTTAGTPTPSLNLTGKLPNGITFTDNGNGTGTLAGTAPLGQEGSYPVTITASNGKYTATQAFTLTVNGTQPVLTADTPATGLPINTPYSYTFAASGDPAPTFKLASGSLPAGMTLDSTGVLSGSPNTAGSFKFTVEAVNGYGTPAMSPAITIAVYGPADMSAALAGPATVTAGTTVVYTVTAYNLGPSAAGHVTATFTLPPGAAFVSAASGGTYANGVVTWNVAAIGSGAHANLKVSITLPTGTSTVTADVQAINPDPNPGNNTTSLTTTAK
jgi:uncharacterized repeat protein (TIGR01451 family)